MKEFKFFLSIGLSLLILAGCTSKKSGLEFRHNTVSVAINIKSNEDPDLRQVNLDLFRISLVKTLQNFQSVNLKLTEAEDADVVIDLNVDEFTIWPERQTVTRQVFSKSVPVGTNSEGKTIYQTVTASADRVTSKTEAKASLDTKLKFRKDSVDTFTKTFFTKTEYSKTSLQNVQGDMRAMNQSALTNGGIPDPPKEWYLTALSSDMARRVSEELRKKYK